MCGCAQTHTRTLCPHGHSSCHYMLTAFYSTHLRPLIWRFSFRPHMGPKRCARELMPLRAVLRHWHMELEDKHLRFIIPRCDRLKMCSTSLSKNFSSFEPLLLTEANSSSTFRVYLLPSPTRTSSHLLHMHLQGSLLMNNWANKVIIVFYQIKKNMKKKGSGNKIKSKVHSS